MLDEIYKKGKEKLKEIGIYEDCEVGVETGFVNEHNAEIFRRFHLVMAGIDAEFADISTSAFGISLNTPIMMAQITYPIPRITDNALIKIAQALKETGSMMWLGFPIPDNLEEIAKIVPVGQMIKPYKDRKKIFEAIDYVEDSGASAFGVDFDSGARTKYLGKLRGPESKPLSSEEIKDIMNASDLPFLLKGVLSIKDAKKAMKIGVENILVTNHAAHTLDYLPHPLEVLPDIMKVIHEDTSVFVDSGFRRGSDAFKALALGADIIMLGRPIIYGLAAGGKDGVKEVISTISEELRRIMTMCGAKSISDVDESMISVCRFR
jgi:isopentenyl diphosphate isomerase/L-lactate dehydrogenase-like FMN-dependent dehydrogenase